MEEKQDQGIRLEKLVSLVESPTADVERYVREENLTREDLEKLLRAERAAKNRRKVVELIESELNTSSKPEIVEEKKIGELKAARTRDNRTEFLAEINGFEFNLERLPFLNFAGHRFELSHPDRSEYIDGVSYTGRPDSQVEQRESPSEPQRTEKDSISPETKTKQEAEPRASQEQEPKREVSKGEEESEEHLESAMKDIMEGEAEKLREKLSEEYGVEEERLEDKNLSELKQLRQELEEKERKKQELIDEFGVDRAKLEGKSMEELEELHDELENLRDKRQEVMDKYDISEEKIQDKDLQELREMEEELEEKKKKRQEVAEKYGVEEEKLEGKDIQELEEFTDKLEKKDKLAGELGKYGYEADDHEEKSVDELQETIEEVKEKKKMMDELGVEMSDDKISDITMEQLEKVREEKDEREELIEELEEHGVNEEMLRKSSNEDLRKLRSEIESDRARKDREGSDTDQSKDEIKEEAEEDLEMLMGAVREEEEDNDEEGNFMEYFDLQNEFKERWSDLRKNRDSKNEEKVRYEKIIGLLEDYRNLETRKSAIKTAQVLKGYLEHILGIERELTYGELAESLRELDERDEDIDILIDFFDKMEEQYRGEIKIASMENVIDSAEIVIDELR